MAITVAKSFSQVPSCLVVFTSKETLQEPAKVDVNGDSYSRLMLDWQILFEVFDLPFRDSSKHEAGIAMGLIPANQRQAKMLSCRNLNLWRGSGLFGSFCGEGARSVLHWRGDEQGPVDFSLADY